MIEALSPEQLDSLAVREDSISLSSDTLVTVVASDKPSWLEPHLQILAALGGLGGAATGFVAVRSARKNAEDQLAYNEERPHDALGRIPPATFRRKVKRESVYVGTVSLPRKLTSRTHPWTDHRLRIANSFHRVFLESDVLPQCACIEDRCLLTRHHDGASS